MGVSSVGIKMADSLKFHGSNDFEASFFFPLNYLMILFNSFEEQRPEYPKDPITGHLKINCLKNIEILKS